MSNIIAIPDYREVDGPVIFLAGPIGSAVDWRAEAIVIICEIAPEIIIATPRSPPHVPIQTMDVSVPWEAHHLRIARNQGCPLFWLAPEITHVCGRDHAQSTRFELGNHVTWQGSRETPRFAMGIDPNLEEPYLRRSIPLLAPGIRIRDTLEATCRDAVAIARHHAR